MRRVMVAMMVAVLAVGLSGCIVRRVESGPDRTESRDVSDFDEVSFSGYGTMTIKQGGRYSLKLSGPSEVVDRVSTEVRGDTLYIDWDTPRLSFFGPFTETDLNIELTVPDLSLVEVDGAGSVEIDGLETERFGFELAGAGELRLEDLDVEELTVDLSGAGSADISGKATDQSLTVSGAGSYDARDLESSSATVEMSGAGSAVVWAKDMLDVEVSGAGSVEYYGSPTVSQNISGIGSVNSRGSR